MHKSIKTLCTSCKSLYRLWVQRRSTARKKNAIGSKYTCRSNISILRKNDQQPTDSVSTANGITIVFEQDTLDKWKGKEALGIDMESPEVELINPNV